MWRHSACSLKKRTVCLLRYLGPILSYFPPLFQLKTQSPSLQKTFCSNPCPLFSNCSWNEVTSEWLCLTNFRKKTTIAIYFWTQHWNFCSVLKNNAYIVSIWSILSKQYWHSFSTLSILKAQCWAQTAMLKFTIEGKKVCQIGVGVDGQAGPCMGQCMDVLGEGEDWWAWTWSLGEDWFGAGGEVIYRLPFKPPPQHHPHHHHPCTPKHPCTPIHTGTSWGIRNRNTLYCCYSLKNRVRKI